jgi:hypothetical protein
MSELQIKQDYVGGSNPIYIGEARPGMSPASAAWRIKLLTYSGSTTPVISWANGTDAFDKVWSARATYTYITS